MHCHIIQLWPGWLKLTFVVRLFANHIHVLQQLFCQKVGKLWKWRNNQRWPYSRHSDCFRYWQQKWASKSLSIWMSRWCLIWNSRSPKMTSPFIFGGKVFLYGWADGAWPETADHQSWHHLLYLEEKLTSPTLTSHFYILRKRGSRRWWTQKLIVQ